jgi:rod shape-determining protein MreD
VKLTSVLLTVGSAVFVQVVLARYTVGGVWAFDLVLVGVIFAALQWGPAAGMVGGTIGGLLQDLLAGEIVGVGALPKTMVGFVGGVVGSQFVLTRPHARVLTVVVVASVVHRLMILALGGLIDQQWPAVSWSAMLTETAINAGCALVLFQVTTMLPGVMERQRMSRRSTFSRRQW